MMTQKLAGLNARLSALRWRRWTARVADGGMALGLLLVALLAGEFLLDWGFRFGRAQRGVMLVAVGLLALWGLRRFVWPALASCESIIDMALAVERRQGIDSDLVAALQFDSAGANVWGSEQLETAVMRRAAALGNQLPEQLDDTNVRLRRKAIPLAIAVAAVVCTAAFYPGHLVAFLNRILLGSAHYPTQTTIKRIVVNGAEAYPALPAGADVKVPFSPGLRFEVESSGVVPDAGEVRLFAEEGGAATSVLLKAGSSPGAFTGELEFMPEAAVYQVFLGDAWSEPGTIRAIVPPVVSMELGHTPPAFASQGRASRHAIGSRQISVMEGSRVSLAVRCANKPLVQAELIIGEARFALKPEDDAKRLWQASAGTPFDEVTVATPFEVVVVDEDGLSPDQPLRGQIHIEVDRAPRVAGAVVTSKVLPGARPSIVWGAADDNGLAEIRLIRQVNRASGEVEESTVVIRKLNESDQPLATLRARYVLDLKPLGLAKGDEVRVTLEALDYRGKRPGATARGEPIVLSVTDESGILAGLVEADEKSARQLDQIIQRQLGIGDAR